MKNFNELFFLLSGNGDTSVSSLKAKFQELLRKNMDGHPQSPPRSPAKTPKKPVTRYGAIKQADIKFGTEERFAWQSRGDTSDVMYEANTWSPSKSVLFGSSLRKGMDEENPDNKKRSTGPGSYEFAGCYDHNSEYRSVGGNRFSQAARQSMAMKTPSPGAVYNIDKQFWNGKEAPSAVGFANGTRGDLYGTSLGANADMFFPKPESGPSITIAKRFKRKEQGSDTPGAIYDVHKKVDFRTGPKFSFGRGKGSRFKEIGYLPEIIPKDD